MINISSFSPVIKYLMMLCNIKHINKLMNPFKNMKIKAARQTVIDAQYITVSSFQAYIV